MRYRFGLFEFDDSQLVLRREQAVVRLQSQPARVLACLLRNRDRIVSREELRQCVWGDSTFVDFKVGLNFCITQVRSALGDEPSNPRYIRTIPKLGYQFIAPVEEVGQSEEVGELTGSLEPVPPSNGRLWQQLPVRPVLWILLLALAFVGGYVSRVYARRSSSIMPIVAVARFDNETGNPALATVADGLTDNLVAQLTDSGQRQFSVIGNAHILRVPRDQRDLTAIQTQLKAKYVVIGQIKPDGDKALILAHLIRLPEQTHIWVARVGTPQLANGAGDSDIADQISRAFIPRLAADIRSGYSSPGLGR
jgi:DNA-binding winged helix-turn-helix (wHTH) protein/TolB-like protein